MAFAAFIPLIAAGVQAISSYVQSRRQSKENKKLADSQNAANERYLDKQNEYNTPANQMQRFQDAGLNRHLIYGQGSPGNQSAPQQAANIAPTDYRALMEMIPAWNQTRMVSSQVQAQNAKTLQTNALAEVNKMQARLIKANPLLDNEGFKAIIEGLKQSALLKEQQGYGQNIQNFINEASAGHQVDKIYHEAELLDKKYDLATADEKIKAEIIQSKQFQNDLLEVQKKFMTDGSISPGHIIQFIQLILTKLVPSTSIK